MKLFLLWDVNAQPLLASFLLRSSPTLSFLPKRFTQQVLFVPRALRCCLPCSGRGDNRTQLKEGVLSRRSQKRSGVLRVFLHLGNTVSHWHRNEKLSPEMWFCSQITFILKVWLRGHLCSTLPNHITIYQGTWYMNSSRGMQSNRLLLFDSNQQIHLIPAILVPVRLKTHLKIKQSSGKRFTCFLLWMYFPISGAAYYLKRHWAITPTKRITALSIQCEV